MILAPPPPPSSPTHTHIHINDNKRRGQGPLHYNNYFLQTKTKSALRAHLKWTVENMRERERERERGRGRERQRQRQRQKDRKTETHRERISYLLHACTVPRPSLPGNKLKIAVSAWPWKPVHNVPETLASNRPTRPVRVIVFSRAAAEGSSSPTITTARSGQEHGTIMAWGFFRCRADILGTTHGTMMTWGLIVLRCRADILGTTHGTMMMWG